MYLNFDCDLKRIKLREPLESILQSPNTYIQGKVAAEMFRTLQNLMELRRCETVLFAQDSNLFPTTDILFSVERKYGESLSDEDMFGIHMQKSEKVSEKHAIFEDQQRE